VMFARLHLMPHLPKFLAEQPELDIDILLTR
jgi:DNA-binding transcriptional LysR family regulator